MTTAKRQPRSLDRKPAKVPAPITAENYLEHLRSIKGVDDEDFAFFGDDIVSSDVREWIPSGSIAIDRLTNGGWPVGRVVEIASWESVGKSTLMDQSIAQCQRIGGVACLIDTEQARDREYTKRLGVDVDSLIVNPAETVEEAFAGIDKMLDVQEKVIGSIAAKKQKRDPPLMLIVWDSIGGTPTNAERDGGADEAHVMEAARSIKMNLRRITIRLAKLRAALICTNHFYQTIGPFASLKTYGGSGMRYFPSIRLWLTKKEDLKIGTVRIGHQIEAKLKKTRVSTPRPPAELGLVWGSGIDNSYSLFEWGRSRKPPSHLWVTQSGNWYYLMLPDGTHEAFQQGFVGFGQVLTKRPEIYEAMAKEFLSEVT